MDQAARQAEHYDVVIIGLGPVGATLANLLGLCGLSTLVLEREATAYFVTAMAGRRPSRTASWHAWGNARRPHPL